MTEKFTPPGAGWIEGLPPFGGFSWLSFEIHHYWDGQRHHLWHRRVVPPLPTEPGTVIRYTDAYGEGMAFLHPDGKWYSGEAGSFTEKGLRELRFVTVIARPHQIAEE